ncbi:MAG: hypothetical protein Q9180_006290, partial [Flavoplaca navasiana]
LELKNAKRIADYAHDHIDDDSDDTKRYLLGFVPKKLRDLPNNAIVEQLQEGYGNGAHILGDGDKYKMKVTCDQETVKCKAGYFAHMRDGTKTMNICNAWFNPKGTPAETLDPPAPTLKTTAEIEKGCKEDKETYKVLENFWTGKGMFWSAEAQCDRSIEIGLTAQDQAANPQDVAHAGVGAPVSDAGTDD